MTKRNGRAEHLKKGFQTEGTTKKVKRRYRIKKEWNQSNNEKRRTEIQKEGSQKQEGSSQSQNEPIKTEILWQTTPKKGTWRHRRRETHEREERKRRLLCGTHFANYHSTKHYCYHYSYYLLQTIVL